MLIKVDSTWYEVNLCESPKDIGSRRATSEAKNIIAAYTHALQPGADKQAYRIAKAKWEKKKESYRREFRQLVSSLATKQITANQFRHRARRLFKSGYETAYRLGTEAAGMLFFDLSKEDEAWLARARSFEYRYLEGFIKALTSLEETEEFWWRADMYIDAMDAMFEAGRVDAYPNEATIIHWRLGVADHCPDCIDLALGGPYRPDSLPATPRSGYTQCLSNCHCSLEIEYEQPSVIDLDIRPASARDAEKLGLIWLAWYLARRRKSKKELDSDFPEYNSGELLDWNVLSKASEYLLEIRHAEQSDDVVEKAVRQYSALEKFTDTCTYLPKWLDPLSKDFTYWHAIGARVKAYHVQQLRKNKGEGYG